MVFFGFKKTKFSIYNISETTHTISIILDVLETKTKSADTFFDLYDFGRRNPSVRLNENVVSRVHGDKKFKISIHNISETTHAISIILDVLETETKLADTFFDSYDFGQRNPSVHLIQDLEKSLLHLHN